MYIGTNPSGTKAIAHGSYGIRILDCTNDLIGGTTAAARNVISGNGRGLSVEFGASSNTIQGNYIGLNATGTAKLPNNGAGVQLDAPNNLIGGAVAGAGNVISGNTSNGIGGTAGNRRGQPEERFRIRGRHFEICPRRNLQGLSITH